MAVRLVRALTIFGVIYASYMLQFALARVFRRDGERTPAWLKARRERIDQRNARRLLRGMLRLRGVFIKLGQILSILGGFLPRAFTRELESLQDNVPPHPFRDLERTFMASFGNLLKSLVARLVSRDWLNQRLTEEATVDAQQITTLIDQGRITQIKRAVQVPQIRFPKLIKQCDGIAH